MLTILTGPTGSGKTTRLLARYASLPAGTADGFASVRVLEDGRLRGYDLVHLATGARRTLCVETPHLGGTFAHPLVYRRFVFDPEAFRFGERIVADALADPAVRTVMIDEIGPVELEGRGFAALFRRTLSEAHRLGKDVDACVRSGILDDVRRAFPTKDPVRLA